MSSCADCLSSMSKRTETHRYAPFVDATNRVLQKLENLNIEGPRETPKGAGRIIQPPKPDPDRERRGPIAPEAGRGGCDPSVLGVPICVLGQLKTIALSL